MDSNRGMAFGHRRWNDPTPIAECHAPTPRNVVFLMADLIIGVLKINWSVEDRPDRLPKFDDHCHLL